RFEFTGATIGTSFDAPGDLRLANLDEGAEYTSFTVLGGGVGDTFAVVEIQSFTTILASNVVELFYNISDNAFSFADVTSTGVLTIDYTLHETAIDAANGVNSLDAQSFDYIEWVDGIPVGVSQSTVCYTDPTNANQRFAGNVGAAVDAATCECGELFFEDPNPVALPKGGDTIYWQNGFPVQLFDMLDDDSSIVVTGAFDYIAGSSTFPETYIGSADCAQRLADGVLLNNSAAEYVLDGVSVREPVCLVADLVTPISAGTYEAEFRPLPADGSVEFDRGTRAFGTLCEIVEPGVTITTQSDPIVVSEDGTSGTIDFRLTAPPAANLTLSITTDDPSEATATPSSLLFTTTNWNLEHLVTVTGVDDGLLDGDQGFTVMTGMLTGSDPIYTALDIPDVPGTNLDNDSPAGVNVSPSSTPLETSEFGGTATLDLSLLSAPSARVQIAAEVDDDREVEISPASLSFTGTDFGSPQRFTLTGLDDTEADGPQPFTVSFRVTSQDGTYDGLFVAPLGGVNSDNEMQIILPPEGVGECDGFGASVDISGNLITVGVPGIDTPECIAKRKGNEAPGMVVIYTLEGGQPVLDAIIPIPEGQVAENFGGAVAASGNLLLVGAPGTPANGGKGGGAIQAALYERTQGQWSLKQPLGGNGAGGNDDAFGASVAIDGNTLVVGAPGDAEDEGQGSGAAYVFNFDGAVVTLQDKLKPGGNPGSLFGSAVAASSGNIAVGAPGSSIGGALAGSMTLYSQIGQNLMDLGTVNGSGVGAGDAFGSSISLDGGLLAVGAPGDDTGGANAGAAWVFGFGAAEFSELGVNTPSDPAAGGLFGQSVDVSGGNILIGAPGSPGGGSAFQFSELLEINQIAAAAEQQGAGGAVAIEDDRLLIGAPQTNASAGAVMLLIDPDRLFKGDFEN
ncbi:MAG: FG-GAP repeat protein, partial [Pseudomonadota bacterium]